MMKKIKARILLISKTTLLFVFVFKVVSLSSSCALLEFDSPELSVPTTPTGTYEGLHVGEYFGIFQPEKEEELFEEINSYRQSAGIEPLLRDPELDEVARIRASELIFDFSRIRIDGSSMMTEFPIDNIGKNDAAIARSYQIAQDVRDAWLNLDHQLDNMESEIYTHIGVGVLEHNNRIFWVVVYVQR